MTFCTPATIIRLTLHLNSLSLFYFQIPSETIPHTFHSIPIPSWTTQTSFSGRAITVKQVGHGLLRVVLPPTSGSAEANVETYLITLPKLTVEGIFFGKPYVELLESSWIVAQSGLMVKLDYSGKGNVNVFAFFPSSFLLLLSFLSSSHQFFAPSCSPFLLLIIAASEVLILILPYFSNQCRLFLRKGSLCVFRFPIRLLLLLFASLFLAAHSLLTSFLSHSLNEMK